MSRQEKGAIHNEQHLKIKTVSDEIVKILAMNHFTISEATDVLMVARKKLFKQDVRYPI